MIDRVHHPDLLVQEACVGFRVPGLVYRLGRGVELRVHVRHGFDDPGTTDHRTLFAVQELAELPGDQVLAQFVPFTPAELLPHRKAVDRNRLVRQLKRTKRIHLQ